MKKVEIEIPVLLPNIPDERDHCVTRLINALQGMSGLSKAHIKGEHPALICIHYDPEIISLAKIQKLARNNGARLTNRFLHLLLDVKGIRHIRHAGLIEASLQRFKGIIEVSVSASGVIRIEVDRAQTCEKEVRNRIQKEGLKIIDRGILQEQKNIQQGTAIFGERTELYLAIASGLFWMAGVLLSFIDGALDPWRISLFFCSIIAGGYYTTIEAFTAIRKGKFEIDFLMLFAAGGAVALGKWNEGALLLFLFSLGHALEHYALRRARNSIAALSELTPLTALKLFQGKQVEVSIEDLEIEDIILVKPNSVIAADGVVIEGMSSVNQAPITGESIPVDKIAIDNPQAQYKLDRLAGENRVFAGTINGSSTLKIKVLSRTRDNTLSRLIQMVKEAETQKSSTQLLTNKIEKYYVPGVLITIIILLFAFLIVDENFEDSFYRAMAVLVAASPCALAISTPSAVLAGVARAARQGVLIKGGRPLEDLGKIQAIAFDKTGTLTEGKPKLTHAIPLKESDQQLLLEVVVSVESMSDHPLATAISAGGRQILGEIQVPDATELEALTARGVRAKWKGKRVYIGNKRLFEELVKKEIPKDLLEKITLLENQGNTVMIVYLENRYLGIIAVLDLPREEARSTLMALKKIGIRRMIMLTGDNQLVANAVGRKIGITDPLGSLLPEDKVAAIEQLIREEKRVAMVGDGVNDAPAMAKSTVGIAMGAAGSDVALETADVALLADKLDNLPFAIGLSRKAGMIINQNLWISLGMVAILVPLTLIGVAEIGPAVVGHEGSTLIVVLNALRLLSYQSKKPV